jgi:two-component system OmpR family response regulator
MRVLLIEDDRMVGAAVKQALKDAAYAVDWVTDGETAIQAAENEAYEVALLDLGLPLTDGREVLRRIRGLGRKLPVIIVTARDGIDSRIDGLDLGADDYLVKPFETRELLARMRAVLRRQGSGSRPVLNPPRRVSAALNRGIAKWAGKEQVGSFWS